MPLENATTLTIASPSLSDSVRALINFAKDKNADYILVNTHSPKGLDRLLLGSFTETLLSLSPIPVLAVNPFSHVRDQIRNILFPTDFSEASWANYKKTLYFARQIQSHVTIFHHFIPPVSPALQTSFLMGGVSVEQYIEIDELEKKVEADRWVNHANQEDVKARTLFHHDSVSLSDSILEAAHCTNCDIIAIGAVARGMAASLLGSTARIIVRDALCPTLVVR